MSLPVFILPAAAQDIQTTHDELDNVRENLGQKFIARVREVLERVESHPLVYGLIWQDVRAVRVKQFRYVLYYRVLVDRSEVLAVLHGSRDASAWRPRV